MPGYADYDPQTATLTYVRDLPQERASVWRALVDPEQLHHWFPSRVSGEFIAGTELQFAFPQVDVAMRGTVIAVEPERRLEYFWGEDRLRFELTANDGGGTRLTLTVTLEGSDKAARDGAGWHVCIERLADHLRSGGAHAPTSELTGEWRRHYEEYQRRGLPALAELPE
jgi:uncharacterized protein YndB with AHSA1/START domain